MGIQRDFQLNLNSPEMRSFAETRSETHLDVPVVPPGGYHPSSVDPKTIDTVDRRPDGGPISLAFVEVHYFDVVQGVDRRDPDPDKWNHGTVIGNFTATIPIEQPIALTLKARLFVQDGIEQALRDAIEAAFRGFTWPGSGDPDDYMVQALAAAPGVSAGMFRVQIGAEIDKIGGLISHREDLDAKLALYEDQAEGEIFDRNGKGSPIHGDPGYFQSRKIAARFIRSDTLDDVPSIPPGPYEIEVPEADAPDAISRIVSHEAESIGCSAQLFEFKTWKIASLVHFPEFMIEWVPISIDIGCGVHIVLSVPVLRIRWSDLYLFAYARYPKDLGQLAEDAFLDCLWQSVLAGAVVGIALGNFPSALAAFKALLSECLKSKFKQFISCMIPGLSIDKVVTSDWA